jgi:DNA-directed RNA polymerase beta' subunit
MQSICKEIKSITFGIYSPDEIRNISVCCVNNTKKNGPGSVYDPRMGTSLSNINCETCNEDASKCPGHPGHIELNEFIIHPLFYKHVVSILSCICFKCYRLMITKDQLDICGINLMKGQARFDNIVEKIKKTNICCHENCGMDKPKIKFSSVDNTVSINHETSSKRKSSSIVLTSAEIHKIILWPLNSVKKIK